MRAERTHNGTLTRGQRVQGRCTPRDDGVGEGVDVLIEGSGRVVAAVVRVCGSDDGAACPQAGHDAGLTDADALLLHRLVDGHPVLQQHRSTVGRAS